MNERRKRQVYEMGILLVIIYIAFISLGLPDAIMGSAWPMIHQELNVSVTYAGVFTMIVSMGTIISSLFSAKMLNRFGTGVVTMISVAMTAAGLWGIYLVPNFLCICLLGIPIGLGAGAVDAALNNFVALHYEAKHMNWLHCFWGIGATTGPLLMSLFLVKEGGWRSGYATIGALQTILVICLLLSLPLWKKATNVNSEEQENTAAMKIRSLLQLKGAKPALLSFLGYCAVESTAGLWGSTYLVVYRGVEAQTAAKWISMYYMGITVGRFITGFLAMKLSNRAMIRMGQIICGCGAVLLLLPIGGVMPLIGLMVIGLGCAPVYPAMLHETPHRFGKERSQGIMGIQMAVAYVGSTFMPPLFGALTNIAGFEALPVFLLVFAVLMLVTSERVGRLCQ